MGRRGGQAEGIERRRQLEINRQKLLERQLERHATRLLARCDLAKLRDKPEAATVVDLRVDSSGDRKPRFSPEALALRFDKAEFATDEADVPSWRKVD